MGVVWAVKSFQEAALANKLAKEAACRDHPVGSSVLFKPSLIAHIFDVLE
jgi:hypothetical protein